jgi:hypothetical protein
MRSTVGFLGHRGNQDRTLNFSRGALGRPRPSAAISTFPGMTIVLIVTLWGASNVAVVFLLGRRKRFRVHAATRRALR